MTPDPKKVHRLAVLKEDENYRFRSFLKSRDMQMEDMDAEVHRLTDEVWAGVDCTKCANCCKEIPTSLSEEDVHRLAIRLGLSNEQVIAEYLEPHQGENPWRTRSKPCPFLKDDRCSVYEDRPADCRGYPYLHEPEFVFRTLGMIERTFTCPIVFEVMERLKGSLGFRGRGW